MDIKIKVPDKNTKEIREAVDNFNTESEIDKLNAVCFWLIKQCNDTNSTNMVITQNNVHMFDKQLGSFEITVKKII